MFAFVRLLLLAIIVLAVALFMQPNLLKELGLQLPEEETPVTTEAGSGQQPDAAAGATEPAQEESTPSSTLVDSQQPAETPAMQETTTETAPAAGPEAADTAGQAPAITGEAAPAEELSVEEPGQPPLEPVPGVGIPQQETPEVTEPVTEAITSESPGSDDIQMESGQPASGSAGEEQAAPPAATDEELPLLPEMPPPFAEGTELPVAPEAAEEQALQPELPEQEGFGLREMPESASPAQEPVSEEPPAEETAPVESGEIPTAGSPELQRVLENIDRTFNNQQ